MLRCAGFVVGLSLFTLLLQAQAPKAPAQPLEFLALEAHFDRVIAARHESLFRDLSSTVQWEERKGRIRSQLARMLWADRAWPSAPPTAVITHRTDFPAYTVENVVLENAPGLFSTANLYLPRAGSRPHPVVLYQCGHANKNQFTRHGAWLASHGIAVMAMDNIEMGEIEFTHHGVYSHAWFHWYSRGFSPLAVEIFNARRALDYLTTRPDIDAARIGATGRSGGGMATFFLAALDDRVKASAPVSGTLSTAGWVRHRLTAAHCDCQYPVNSHGLLYSEVGALIAPRAQLLVNADADRGFPMDAFEEMAAKMRIVYRLYNSDALSTAVTGGGHTDTEAIRLPVYSFFLKTLLGTDVPVTSEGPLDLPQAGSLVCFRDGLPLNERLTRVDEELIAEARLASLAEVMVALRTEVFGYFPAAAAPLNPQWGDPDTAQGRTVRKVSFASFEGLNVRALYSLPSPAAAAKLPGLLVVDDRKGIRVWGNEQPLERNQWGDRAVLIVETLDRGTRALEANLRSFSDDDALHHMKRQAMIAGTTLESMQVYEILRSLEFLRSLPEVDPARLTIAGKFEAGINGLYAALLDGKIARVILGSPPASHRQGPHYLGILKYTDIAHTIDLMRQKVRLYGEIPEALRKRAAACESLADCLR